MRLFLLPLLALMFPIPAMANTTQASNSPENPATSQELNSLNEQRTAIQKERNALIEEQDDLHNWTIGLGVVAALIGILAGITALGESRKSYKIRDTDSGLATIDSKIADWKKIDSDWRIAKTESASTQLGIDLQNATAESTRRQTQLEVEQRKTAEAQKEAVEAQIGLRRYIEQSNLPRSIYNPRLGSIEESDPAERKKWMGEVAKFAGTTAIIQPIANDSEAFDVARAIQTLLTFEGWHPEIVDAEQSRIPNGYIFPGVALVTLEKSPFQYGTPPEIKLVPTEPSAASHAVYALMNLLAMDLGPNKRSPNIWGVQPGSELDDDHTRQWTRFGFVFPPNSVLILVGPKPVPNWIGSNVPLETPK